MILSVWGWIVCIIAVLVFQGYKSSKGWPNWTGLVGTFIIFVLCTMLFPSTPSFTGNIEKDAKIINERIRDGESVDEVSNDLAEYYVDEGYGLNNAKKALNRAAELNYER